MVEFGESELKVVVAVASVFGIAIMSTMSILDYKALSDMAHQFVEFRHLPLDPMREPSGAVS